MRIILPIFLCSLFGYIELYNGLVWVSYEVRKSEVIREYCENKDNPEMKCEGSCHLKKMMLQETDKEERSGQTSFLPEILPFLVVQTGELINTFKEISTEFTYQDLYAFTLYRELTIPPET